MNIKNKTKAQLIKELDELQLENASLKTKIGSTIGKKADIINRERTEEALLESERKFRDTLKYLDEGYYSVTTDGLLIEHNQAFNRILGIDIDKDMQGANLPDFWQNPDDRKEYLNELMTKGFIRNFLINAKTINGEKVVVLASSHLIKDEKGGLVRIEGTFTDFSDRKRMEEDLREAKENLENRILERTVELTRSKQLLDETGRLARVGGWEIDPRKNELIWTDVTKMIHEVEQDYIPSLESAINFYVPEDVPIISEAVRCAIEEGKSFDVELQLITGKQNRIWVRAIGQAYRENGEIVRISGVFHDINEHKLVEEELKNYHNHLEELVNERTVQLESAITNLERSNKELEQFAYVASHDLQEPLRMVSSFTQLLEKKYKESLDVEAHEYIKFAVDGANRMQLLINDLLEYSRVGTRGKPFVQVDCYSLLGIVRRNLQSRIEETHTLVTNDDLPIVMADQSQLIRLFQNLIDNAIKYHGDSTPAVHISAKENQGEWVFSVSDNGIGIEKEYFETIFVIFQRLHGRDEFSGTGIGLSIAKKIVTRHGGKIWLESEPGKGTTFYFTLPKKV